MPNAPFQRGGWLDLHYERLFEEVLLRQSFLRVAKEYARCLSYRKIDDGLFVFSLLAILIISGKSFIVVLFPVVLILLFVVVLFLLFVANVWLLSVYLSFNNL
ncbi:hypothetical protein ACUN24_20405 [Pedobacter sp. WC2501]|uniref:hypothetical protein n=1 Tax=Pedobacter sp. WC2501 TaxID=3461400 RepID=UPI004045F64D